MSDIITLKLTTGEELVAEEIDSGADKVCVKNPVVCVVQRTQQGAGIGFVPWVHSSQGPFYILRQHIITDGPSSEDIRNGYNQIFGAGIVVPPKELILG